MIQSIGIAAKQVLILFILAAVGVVADKLKIFPEKTAKACADLLFYIVTPAKIIESFITLEYSPEKLKSLCVAFGLGFLLNFTAVVLSTAAFARKKDENSGIYIFASSYGNCGYMGLPLTNAILGTEGVFYCSAYVAVFQMFNFTHGVYIMSSDKSNCKFDYKKLVLNPGVIAVLIGLPIFLFSVKLPEIISVPIVQTANLNTPLAMLIFGTCIANADFRTIFKEKKLYLTVAVKLILIPLVLIGLLRLVGLGGALLTSLAIAASAPSANNTVMFSAKYGKNVGLASQIVAAVSAISIITMPVIIALSQMSW